MEPIDKKVLHVALGKKPADLVITNGKVVNVFSREFYEGGVAISGRKIAATGEVNYTIGQGTEVIDAGGAYLIPGLIDGHVHIESSMLDITHFAEMAVCHGTTSVMTDLHEVAVVGGWRLLEKYWMKLRTSSSKYILWYLLMFHFHQDLKPRVDQSAPRK